MQKQLATNALALRGQLAPLCQPYLANAVVFWEQALIAAQQDQGHFAAHVLRPILERAAFLWATSGTGTLDPTGIVTSYQSEDRKGRQRTTEKVLDAAVKHDPSIRVLYDDILSRYFSHLSYLDTIPSPTDGHDKTKLGVRGYALPLLLLFDVGNCIFKAVRHDLANRGVSIDPLTGGRAGHEWPAENYVRVGTHVMCERHSRKHGVPLATLFSGVRGIKGTVGATDIYRGGMELRWYGDPASGAPSLDELKDFSLFAVGKQNLRRVVVKMVSEQKNGNAYELRWPKEWEITYVAVAMAAANPRLALPMFDYVTDFASVLQRKR